MSPHCSQEPGLVDSNLMTVIGMFEYFDCRIGGSPDLEFELGINWLTDNGGSQPLFNAVLPDLIALGVPWMASRPMKRDLSELVVADRTKGAISKPDFRWNGRRICWALGTARRRAGEGGCA